MNTIQIKKVYNKLNSKLINAASLGQTEVHSNLLEKIRVLKSYAKLNGFYIGSGSFLYK